MCLLDCGPQRDGAGELLPSPALFAEEAVGEGLWDAGVHDKIFHRSRQHTDAFQKNGAISLKRIRTLAQAVEHLVVNSRIPPPFANRPFGEQCLRW